MRTSKWLASLVLLATFPVSVLHAQPAKTNPGPDAASASPPPPPVVPPPDVVRLKSGAFFRGTLVEHDPKGRTVLQTATGTKEISSAEVTYAGPIAGDPGAGGTAPPLTATASPTAVPPPAAPPASAALGFAPVQLRANLPDVHFYVERSRGSFTHEGRTVQAWQEAGNYQLLCAAPCSAPLPPGTYRFGLAFADLPPIPAGTPVEVKPGGALEGTLTSRAGQRKTGTILLYGGIVVTGFSIVPIVATAGDRNVGYTPIFLTAGIAAGGAAMSLTGLYLRLRSDDAEVRTAEADQPVRAALGPAATQARPLGPTFTGQF